MSYLLERVKAVPGTDPTNRLAVDDLLWEHRTSLITDKVCCQHGQNLSSPHPYWNDHTSLGILRVMVVIWITRLLFKCFLLPNVCLQYVRLTTTTVRPSLFGRLRPQGWWTLRTRIVNPTLSLGHAGG